MTHPYASEAYARAFEGLADPVALPEAGCWVLQRSIPGTGARDAIGCYPLCALDPGSDLPAAFDRLAALGLVSLVLVPDALCGPEQADLRRHFDLVRAFKTHYVRDPRMPFAYGRHHRYEVKRARAACAVAEVELAAALPDWRRLYGELAVRRGIAGLQAFSPRYFERLAAMPGLHAHAARVGGRVVGMHLWFEHEAVVYSHLSAADEEGYRQRAGYALVDFALERFSACRLIDLGAGAGLADDPHDGLSVFKRGFANRQLPFLLCGKVLDRAAYDALAAGREGNAFFPAYRG